MIILWETIEQGGYYGKGIQSSEISRAKVPGGWLVREVRDVMEEHDPRSEYRSSLIFIADPEHTWGRPEEVANAMGVKMN